MTVSIVQGPEIKNFWLIQFSRIEDYKMLIKKQKTGRVQELNLEETILHAT